VLLSPLSSEWSARQESSEAALQKILIRARAIRDSPHDLVRSAVAFFGNRITGELPSVNSRAYGTWGLVIAAARGEDINAVVCAALREYVGTVPM
jgi:hypothetical protein